MGVGLLGVGALRSKVGKSSGRFWAVQAEGFEAFERFRVEGLGFGVWGLGLKCLKSLAVLGACEDWEFWDRGLLYYILLY